jgi:hypothetical protein
MSISESRGWSDGRCWMTIKDESVVVDKNFRSWAPENSGDDGKKSLSMVGVGE